MNDDQQNIKQIKEIKMNKKLKIIVLSVVFATAGYAQDTHTGLNKLEMQKVFSSSDVKTMQLDSKEVANTQGEFWWTDIFSLPFFYPGFNWLFR